MSVFGNAGARGATVGIITAAALIGFPETAGTTPIYGRVPAAMAGTWTWGSVNPGRYVNKVTGEYAGHAGGGAVSHTFSPDGTYRRYVLIHMGAGYSNESVFSAMEGRVTVNEAAGTFTLRMTKGQISFEKKSGITRRPLSREDMERGGTVFTYRLEKDEDGKPRLLVNDRDKPASEGRAFYRETVADTPPAEKKPAPEG